jgi:copper chaperone CopZ
MAQAEIETTTCEHEANKLTTTVQELEMDFANVSAVFPISILHFLSSL